MPCKGLYSTTLLLTGCQILTQRGSALQGGHVELELSLVGIPEFKLPECNLHTCAHT